MNSSIIDFFSNEIEYGIKSFSSLGSYPVFLLIILFLFKVNFYEEAFVLLIAFILLYALGLPIRANFFRNRLNPTHHAQIYENSKKIKFSSFPSFHATRITVLSLMITQIFNYSLEIVFLALIVSVLVCYSRILLQRHYFIDVIGGVVCGILLWFISINIVFLII